MICKKCQNEIQDNIKFCTNCGTPVTYETEVSGVLTKENIINDDSLTNQNIQSQETQLNTSNAINISSQSSSITQQSTTNNTQNNQTINTKINSDSIIKTILASIIKPISNIKNNNNILSSISNSFILLGIVSVMTMVINLVVTVLKTLFTKSQACFMGYCYGEELSIAEKFKSIAWWPLIWQYVVIPAGIILLITCVYYIVSLIFKKTLNFPKLLGITTLSIVPALIVYVLISPIIGLMWAPGSIILIISGMLYSMSILFINLDKELNFENKDKFILFNLISVFVIILIVYLVGTQIISSQISSSLGGLDFGF